MPKFTVVSCFASYQSQVIEAHDAEEAEQMAKDGCDLTGDAGEEVGTDYHIYSVDPFDGG